MDEPEPERDVVRYVPFDSDEPWPEEEDDLVLPGVWPWAEPGELSVRSTPQIRAMWAAVDTWWGPRPCEGSVSVALEGVATCSEAGCDGVGGHDVDRVVACCAGMEGVTCRRCWRCADG